MPFVFTKDNSGIIGEEIMFKKKSNAPEKTPEEVEKEIAELDRLLKFLEEHPEIEEFYARECEKANKAFPPYIVW